MSDIDECWNARGLFTCGTFVLCAHESEEIYVFVQGADFPSVHRAGVQSLRGGSRGADQPSKRLQGPRNPGGQIPSAGPDLVVLSDTFLPPGSF